jgi:D-aminoacyl-tRNA deacylase
MRAVVQRVLRASVTVAGKPTAAIDGGLLVLVGVSADDTEADAAALADKVVGLRIFRDDEGRMNCSVVDEGGSVLVVSQFTLIADLAKGRRPSFVGAAVPEKAEPLVEAVAARIGDAGVGVASGVFGALMEVALVNDGPVTLVIDVHRGRVR